jgi:hypothetical protein
MPDITKIAFLNSIWILREYLSDIVIGGWLGTPDLLPLSAG